MISLVVLGFTELRRVVWGEIAVRVAVKKADGDNFFRENEYEDAISSYSEAIDLSWYLNLMDLGAYKGDAVLYCNRRLFYKLFSGDDFNIYITNFIRIQVHVLPRKQNGSHRAQMHFLVSRRTQNLEKGTIASAKRWEI